VTRASFALSVIASLLLIVGLAATYVRIELAEPEAFADRSVDALRSDEVRAVIAEQVAVEVLEERSPQLVASRPLVLAAVEALLETDSFERVLRSTAINAHDVLFRDDSDVVVELQEARGLLVPAIESISPELAHDIPEDISPQIAEIRGSDAATSAVRVADGARAVSWPLLLVALVMFGLAIWRAPDRRRAAAGAGLLISAGAAAGLAAMAGLRAEAIADAGRVGLLSDEDAHAAAGATWSALVGALEDWYLATAIAGLAIVGGALLAEARVDRAAALRRVTQTLAGGRLPRAVSVLRGLALAALGALILLRVEPAAKAALFVLGGMFVLLGLAEALTTIGRPGPRPRSRVSRRQLLAAGGVLALAAAGGATVAIVGSGAPSPPPEDEIVACNGLPELCDRRLDQVVLAGTHNSMSAADRPGWFFANQTRPIPEQLRDGIRLLMIDPHYGIVDSQGRVRTELSAEGTNRNRVARRLGPGAVEAAEGLAGRLGLVPTDGEREIFLCHTLCELGAERMSSTLDEIRGFLEGNQSEVLIVLTESSVAPDEVEREFERADLEPYLATLERDAPLPTLREMIASGRRLLVLDERDGGDAPWYQPAFVFIHDTRIGSLLRSETACDPNRGTPGSPLFLMNHWLDRFPPPPAENGAVADRASLLERLRSCRTARGQRPNLIAVDFYEGSDLMETARELNRGLAP